MSSALSTKRAAPLCKVLLPTSLKAVAGAEERPLCAQYSERRVQSPVNRIPPGTPAVACPHPALPRSCFNLTQSLDLTSCILTWRDRFLEMCELLSSSLEVISSDHKGFPEASGLSHFLLSATAPAATNTDPPHPGSWEAYGSFRQLLYTSNNISTNEIQKKILFIID